MNNNAVQLERSVWKFYLQVFPFLDENIEKDMKAELENRFFPVFPNKDDIIAAVANFCMGIRRCQNREQPRLSSGLDVDISTSNDEVVRKVTSACAEIWSSYDPIGNAYTVIKEVAEKMLPVRECSMARNDNLASISIQLKIPHEISIDAFEQELRSRSLPCRWNASTITSFTGVSVSIMLSYLPPEKN